MAQRRKLLQALSLVTATTIGIPAQSNAPPEKFEVVSIKPSPPPPAGWHTVGCQGGPKTPDPGVFRCQEIKLANLIEMAFSLEEYQFPDRESLDSSLYSVDAKVPSGTTRQQLDHMLQNLLIERCKLVYHYQKKEMSIYNLVLAKGGIKMKLSTAETAAQDPHAPAVPETPAPTASKRTLDSDGFPYVPPARRGGVSFARVNGRGRWATVYTSMHDLAGMLAFLSGHPVVDTTGIVDKYDFTLSWVYNADESAALSPSLTGPSLAEAVQEQLGLHLEQKRGPADVFVVDHVERPSAN